jgi:hypothetical protein
MKRLYRVYCPVLPVSALLAAVVLSGCGVVRNVQANNSYDASVAAYKDCLARSGATGCEAQRLAMEADRQRVEVASVGGGGGGNAPYVPPVAATRVDPVVCNTMRTGIMSTTTCN